MGPKRGADGKLDFVLPMGDRKLPGIAAEDIGRCAHGIFKRGAEFVGKTVGIAGEHLTGAEMAAWLSRALGQEVRYQDDPARRSIARFGFPGADDLGNMFQFNHDFSDDFCARAQRRVLALAEPGAAELRRLARGQRETHPDRVKRPAASRRRRAAAGGAQRSSSPSDPGFTRPRGSTDRLIASSSCQASGRSPSR